MAIFDTTWYLNYGNGSTTGYYAVPKWAANTAYTAGQLVRQNSTPAVGSERIFICIAAGTSSNPTEPTWVLTYGAKTTDNTVTWMEITGRSAVNGDQTNTNNWAALKNKAVVLGQLMVNGAGDHYFIVTTAGTTGNGSEPSWNTTTGATTTDNTVTWTCIGAVGSFSAWGAPAARKQHLAGTGFMAVGNTCFVASAHAETQASAIAITASNGTFQNPLKFICTGTTHSPPQSGDATTGASISTTGANGINEEIRQNQYGVAYNVGSSSNAANFVANSYYFENCIINLNNTNTASTISYSSLSNTIFNEYSTTLKNCKIRFGSTSQTISGGSNSGGGNNSLGYNFIGCTFADTGSIPATLFFFPGAARVICRDSDLSAITGNVANISGMSASSHAKFQNCALGSGVTLTTGSFINSFQEPTVAFHNCDSDSTNYRYYYANAQGTVQQETTVVRTGGATDGTTPISWNITTSANTTFYTPFISEEIAQWNDATGSSKTATVYLTGNASLNNNDIWMEIEYPSSSGAPLGATADTRMALQATPSALTSDSSTWGGSITNKYKLSIGLTPQMKGPVKLRLYVAKTSTTVYVDPYLYIQ